MFLFRIIILFTLNSPTSLVKFENSMDYGPYKVRWGNFSQCRGPKASNATIMDVRVAERGTKHMAAGAITVTSPTTFEEMTITVWSVKQNKRRNIAMYKFKDPCQQFFIQNILYNVFRSKSCLIQKGTYKYEEELEKFPTLFMGRSFFYGRFVTKSVAVSKKRNIICLILDLEYMKI